MDHNYVQLGRQLVASLTIACWSFTLTWLMMKALDLMGFKIRASADIEEHGDKLMLGELAWNVGTLGKIKLKDDPPSEFSTSGQNGQSHNVNFHVPTGQLTLRTQGSAGSMETPAMSPPSVSPGSAPDARLLHLPESAEES